MISDLSPEKIRILLNRIVLRDDKAVKELYVHYQKSLYAFARYRTGDDVLAEEVVQETFLTVLAKPNQFDFTSKFSVWLCGIAKNKAKDALRKRGLYQTRNVELDDQMIETLQSDKIDVLDQMEAGERDEILRECIERLSNEHREAMLLTYHQGASIEEVSNIQEVPQGTIKTRLFHARKKVQDCVRRAYGEGVVNV